MLDQKSITRSSYWAILLFVSCTLPYTIYFFGEEIVNAAGVEDGVFEYLTALFFLLASIFSLRAFFLKKNLWLLLFALVLFVGFGEEVSWGQRIFAFETPEFFLKKNVQKEFTIHNLEVLNAHDFDHNKKSGFKKLITVDFLYKLFCICFGAVMPVVALLSRRLNTVLVQFKLPIPSVWIGSFFLYNWLTFKLIKSFFLPEGYSAQYYDTVGEISEFNSALIFFVISINFFLDSTKKKSLKKS
jgi:hypothetical protein